MRVLVTGGAGYIGSHACKRLLDAGHCVVLIDNFERGNVGAIERLTRLAEGPGVPGVPEGCGSPAGPEGNGDTRRLEVHIGSAGDRAVLRKALRGKPVDAALHFAALAYVRESMDVPLRYYDANTSVAPALIDECHEAGVARLVFSSTCATYGAAPEGLIPIREDCPQSPINPYGWSKLFIERMLRDYSSAHGAQAMGIAMLRYFNVAGCDRQGVLGEDHRPETHIIPLLLQTALGQREAFTVLGSDHATPDGTCVRDYIHVEDLVDAHLTALGALQRGELRAYNLGIGRGFSVREVIAGVERVTGKTLTIREGARHPGDPPTLYCDPSKIAQELGWRASIRELDDIIVSAWEWFRRHPDGYGAGSGGRS